MGPSGTLRQGQQGLHGDIEMIRLQEKKLPFFWTDRDPTSLWALLCSSLDGAKDA